MARNESGCFKKMLNVIGIVDDQKEIDAGYDARYNSGRSAQSRQSTYVPRKQNNRGDVRSRGVVQDSRNQRPAPRNSYNNINEGYTVRRNGAEVGDDFDAPAARRGEGPVRESAPTPRYNAPAVRSEAAPAARGGNARTVMFNIASLEECCDVVDALIANNIVLLMLEQLDDRMTQRVVDTLSGAAFALHATIRKASDRTYLVAPRTVEVNDPGYFGRRG